MTLQAFRETPSFTIGSGPAAGVAAALHELGLSDGLVVECGGTSSNVSIVKRGRAALRTLRVMERPTAIRSVDSWVVGAAGGSMARLRRRKFIDTGPRSAHVANLPYACFADAGELRGAELELIAPREGDPESYAVLSDGERRWALTATCAGTALGLGDPSEEAAAAAGVAFGIVAAALRTTPEKAARQFLDGAVAKIARATKEAASAHDFGPEVPVIALGGSGTILAPEVARVLSRPIVIPDNPEVLSSIGAALSLIRAEVVRTAVGGDERSQITREAELACLAAGAAPQTIRVETFYEHDANLIRGVATGAVALESGAANRRQVGDEECIAAAARALEVSAEELDLIAHNDFYRVFIGNGKVGCAIVDGTGAVPFAEKAKSVLKGGCDELIERLQPAIESQSVNLGLAEIAPRVVVVRGPNIVDLSDARSAAEILEAARELLADYDGEGVAIVWS